MEQFPIYEELETYLSEIGIEEYFVGKVTQLSRDAVLLLNLNEQIVQLYPLHIYAKRPFV